MSRRTLFLVLVLVIAAVVNPHELDASASADTAERPRLSGRWRLDLEKSEDAEAKLREAMERRRPSGGMGGRPGGFGGGGFGGPDDHPRLTETFTVRPDPRQLEVEIKVDGPFALSVRRVYVAAVD